MGAWIETTLEANYIVQPEVAPCMGAWIETFVTREKQGPYQVAPCMGAWIETRKDRNEVADMLSHPAWVRGLKR